MIQCGVARVAAVVEAIGGLLFTLEKKLSITALS